MHAAFSQECHDAIHSEALADAAWIEFHRFASREPHAMRGGVELHLIPTDFVAKSLLFRLCRHMTVLRFESPGPKQRTYGDVECAVRLPAPVERSLKKV